MNKAIILLSFLAFQTGFAQKTTKAKTATDNRTTEQKLELSKTQKDLFNGKFQQFIAALKISDKPTMESLLADKAKETFTEKVNKMLLEQIDFKRKIVIFKTGYKSLFNGENYPMVQYKYEDDKSKPDPKEIITAVFQEDGKIMGIKPYKQPAK